MLKLKNVYFHIVSAGCRPVRPRLTFLPGTASRPRAVPFKEALHLQVILNVFLGLTIPKPAVEYLLGEGVLGEDVVEILGVQLPLFANRRDFAAS
jgi:hypothetical protein